MNFSEHFSLAEMVHSEYAARHGIDNAPPPEALANLKHICPVYMEPIRHWLDDHPIIVTSGYRCKVVNSAVGGSANSSHMLGSAVDFICPGFGTPLEVAHRLLTCFRTEKIFDPTPEDDIIFDVHFDELIYEFSWVHVGFKAPMRGNIMTVRDGVRKWGLGDNA